MTIQPNTQSIGCTEQSERSSRKGIPCHTTIRTPLSLSVISDIHTSDLTDTCPHKVLLKHEQKTKPVATTALFRGVLIGKILECVHEQNHQDINEEAFEDLVHELEGEGRIVSDAVLRNKDEILEEIGFVKLKYYEQLMPLFDQCELVGTELPCRVKIGDTSFASHIDLLVRDTSNVFGHGEQRLLCIDWKYRQVAPTKAYLSRHLQMYLYWLMILEGSVMAYKAVDGWVEYGEVPQMLWCHLPYLKPFARKTIIKDEDGSEVQYKKGDTRPIHNIMRPVNFKPEAINSMKADLLDRVAMMRSGFFPKIPDPVGCQICEAQDFCARGDTPELMENK